LLYNKSLNSFLENKLFCGCTEHELIQLQLDENQTDSIQQKTSIWEKFKYLVHNPKDSVETLPLEDCRKEKSLIKCDDPQTTIKIILASIGIHENVCVRNASTYASLHSTGKSSCHEALKSTDITVKM